MIHLGSGVQDRGLILQTVAGTDFDDPESLRVEIPHGRPTADAITSKVDGVFKVGDQSVLVSVGGPQDQVRSNRRD